MSLYRERVSLQREREGEFIQRERERANLFPPNMDNNELMCNFLSVKQHPQQYE